MKTEDIERSFFNHVHNLLGTPEELRADIPGDWFRPESISKEWIEPRLSGVTRKGNSRADTGIKDPVTFRIRCFVVSQPKGGRYLLLSNLVDRVRAVVDPSYGVAPAGAAAHINNVADNPQPVNCIGYIQFLNVSEVREYGIDVTIGQGLVSGLDVAILTINALVVGRG